MSGCRVRTATGIRKRRRFARRGSACHLRCVRRPSGSFPACGVVLTLAVSACAAASQGPARGDRNVITRAELEAQPVSDAYEAVARLRPSWLRRPLAPTMQAGGNPVMVYVDRQQFGTSESLRGLTTEHIERIEFVSARDATTRYGTGHPSGVIEVTTRRR